MKFLCVKCDGQMLLKEVKTHESGSLSVVFHCPECTQAVAMLTNAGETQLLTSLGIKLGHEGGGASGEKKGGCPFAAMLQSEERTASSGIVWSSEAKARLDNIPELVRPMAKSGIEKFAQERGYTQIDVSVLEAARSSLL